MKEAFPRGKARKTETVAQLPPHPQLHGTVKLSQFQFSFPGWNLTSSASEPFWGVLGLILKLLPLGNFWCLSGSDSAYSETTQLSPIQKTAHIRVNVEFPAAWALSLLTVRQDWHLRQKSEVHRKEVHIPSPVQEKSRQHGSMRYETFSFWVGSYTICRWKGFTEFSSNIPKQRIEIRKASKRCLEAKARKCKEGTSTSRKGRGGSWSSARSRNKGKSAFRLWKLHQNAPWKHSSNSEQAPQAPLGSQHQSSAVEL